MTEKRHGFAEGDLSSKRSPDESQKRERFVFDADPIGAYLEKIAPDLDKVESPPDLDLSYLSNEQKAETMWALYSEALRLRPRSAKKEPKDKKKSNLILGILRELYQDDTVREIYLTQSNREKQEKQDINGKFEEYHDLSHSIATIESEVDSFVKNIFTSRGKGASEVDVLLYESGKRQLDVKKTEMKDVLHNNGELNALAQYETLRKYNEQLREGNFIWTDSRRKHLDELKTAALSGDPVLVSGETGTGKTVLVEQASLILTGHVCNKTPGKDTRFDSLIAKPKISPNGESYYEYKEIGEAVTGRKNTLQEQPEHDGMIVADDEFNLLESAEQTSRLAFMASLFPGKKVKMPVTNQEIKVAQNLLYCAMVNLASERYERKKIPPEVLRKFAKVNVDYPLQSMDDPELYEMMLSSLIDKNGRFRASAGEVSPEYEYEEKEELSDDRKTKNTMRVRRIVENKTDDEGHIKSAGGFLWRFASAMGELNKSSKRQDTILKAKGEGQFVANLFIDIGKIIGWLKEYAKMGQGECLEDFICKKLKENFLDKEEYSKEDRNLVKDFLEYFDIDVDSPFTDKPEFKNLSPIEVGLLSPRVEYRKILRTELQVNEGWFIDQEGNRVEFVLENYNLGGKEIKPGNILVSPDGKIFKKYIGKHKDTGLPVFRLDKEPTLPDTYTEDREITENFTELKDGLNKRFSELNLSAPKLDILPLPPDFNKEHLAVLEDIFGQKLDVSTVPKVVNWQEYFQTMYPARQRPEDTQANLVSHNPNYWKNEIDKNVVGGKETVKSAFERSISNNTKELEGQIFFTETIQKPNYIDGTQYYGTKEGTDATKDKLLPIIRQVFGNTANRFNLTWDQINQKLIPKVKEALVNSFRSKHLPIPEFDIICTPAIISNLEMSLRHPENSSTSTGEWSSTTLLKKDNTDSGRRLVVGTSVDGGAGYVFNDHRGSRWGNDGFRLSVALKNT